MADSEHGGVSDAVARANWFFAGLGVILILRGLMLFSQTSSWRASSGLILGGAILATIAVGTYLGMTEWWPFLVILVGAWIIVNALMSKSRNPRP